MKKNAALSFLVIVGFVVATLSVNIKSDIMHYIMLFGGWALCGIGGYNFAALIHKRQN